MMKTHTDVIKKQLVEYGVPKVRNQYGGKHSPKSRAVYTAEELDDKLTLVADFDTIILRNRVAENIYLDIHCVEPDPDTLAWIGPLAVFDSDDQRFIHGPPLFYISPYEQKISDIELDMEEDPLEMARNICKCAEIANFRRAEPNEVFSGYNSLRFKIFKIAGGSRSFHCLMVLDPVVEKIVSLNWESGLFEFALPERIKNSYPWDTMDRRNEEKVRETCLYPEYSLTADVADHPEVLNVPGVRESLLQGCSPIIFCKYHEELDDSMQSSKDFKKRATADLLIDAFVEGRILTDDQCL